MRLHFNRAVFWLVFLWTCLLATFAPTATAVQNRCREVFSIGYDVASNEVTLGYDRPVEAAYDGKISSSVLPYDSVAMLAAHGEETQGAEQSEFYGNFAKFLAAETGTQWTARDFVQEVATRAENKIGGTGALAGTDKHA